MRKTRLRAIAAFIIASIAVFSVVSVGQAAGTKKMLQAWFGLSNVKYNGVDYTQKLQPFAVNDYTYVRLRDILEILGKDFQWDQATRTVIVSDKPDPDQATIDSLKLQLEGRDFRISQLERKIEELEAQLEENRVMDLDALEEQLNDDYGEYEGIEFAISLSGDEDDVTVKISVDMDDYGSKWNKLTTAKKQKLLQNICYDILDVYEDADIEGYIRDSSKSGTYKILSFATDSKGTVNISGNDLANLEDELNDEFGDELGGVSLSIKLEGDKEDITFTVNVNLNKYKTKWNNLDDNDIKDFMLDIYYYIKDEFKSADIEGYIYDTYNGKNVVRIYRTSTGGVTVKFL